MKFFKPSRRRLKPAETSSESARALTSNTWLIIVAIVAIAGYFIGTQNGRIVSFFAPFFGQKVYTEPVDLSSVEATFRALKANYDGQLDDQTLIEGANKGMASATGDKYTVYMNAEEAAQYANDLSGNIGGGIGAEIGLRSSKTTIVRVLDNNPAKNAGLKAGDALIEINDQSTEGWTVDKTVNEIRGDVGTTVKLLVERDGNRKEYNVERSTIIDPSVRSEVRGDIGVLIIQRFDSETGSLARAAARELVNKGVKGIVLDLRYNGGGYVDAAQEVASLWLDNKVVVSERAGSRVISELKSSNNPILKDVPTVVLVNEGTASASEIVAGALKDHGVAKVVGKTTYGKGSVQTLVNLPEGAQLKVTIAKWYTPSGHNITEQGITPDIKVELTSADEDAGRDPQLDRAKTELSA